jgi:hypothetical protein
MTIELSLMIASGAVIVGLYLHRYFEVKLGVNEKIHTIRTKTDPVIKRVHLKTTRALSHLTPHHFSLFLHNLFVYAAKFFMHLARKVHDSSARLAEKASRRKEDLSKGRAASFYLKQIKDAKDNGGKPENGTTPP